MERVKTVHIGLPELSEKQLIELGDLAQETVVNYIFEHLSKSEVKDIEVTTRINRNETLNLEVEAYIEVPIFVKVDADKLIENALEKAYEKVEERLREIAGQNKV